MYKLLATKFHWPIYPC